MTAGERFKNWIDGLAEDWKDRLRGWMASWVEKGIITFIEFIEPEAIENVNEILSGIRDAPFTPGPVKSIINRMLTPGAPIPLLIVIPIAIVMFVPMLFGLFQPLGRLFNYQQDKIFGSFRMDPGTITSIWNRDRQKYEWLFGDLDDLGYTGERRDIIKELANIIPPLADMVRFADFSALDPEVIAKWREFYDAPNWIVEPFKLLGIFNIGDRDWANKYWFSHWRQPGRFELGEMYRRGLLGIPVIGQAEVGGAETEGEAENMVKLAYRTQGFSAFWQGKLLELVREWPTRVDVRRWWDMRTIDEGRLVELYQGMGYFGKDLKDYVLWTKVYVAFPDLITRWKNGWITEDEVRAELLGLGMPEERVNEMIQTKIKAAQPERTSRERDLTKADIVKGVKKDVITWDQGVELLMDLGYTEDEADFILDISIAAEAGSPESFEEFKGLTTKYKIATGREAKPMSEELKKAGDEVVKLTKEVQALEEAVELEKAKLIDEEVLPAETTAKVEELQVARNRAIAELERIKSDYSRLLAEWRFTGGE